MSVWLRTADAARQPALRLAVEGKAAGQPFYRSAQFGQGGDPQHPLRPIPAEWSLFVIEVNDLPRESLGPLQVRFELLGAGVVWIDTVQLCELAFSRREHKELLRLLTPADVELRNGRVADCLRLLEGYWPRFLVEHVRLPEPPVARRPQPAPPATRPPQEAERSSGLLDRLKNFVPHRLRF